MIDREKLPETYKGYKVDFLLNILKDMKTEEGTKATKEEILTMREMMKEYKMGVHAPFPTS